MPNLDIYRIPNNIVSSIKNNIIIFKTIKEIEDSNRKYDNTDKSVNAANVNSLLQNKVVPSSHTHPCRPIPTAT